MVSADLLGFSHRTIALIAALIVRAGNRRPALDRYSALVGERERRSLGRAAVLLALADEVERRMPKGARVSVRRQPGKGPVVLELPVPHDWEPSDISVRFQRVFGRELGIEPVSEAAASVSLRG